MDKAVKLRHVLGFRDIVTDKSVKLRHVLNLKISIIYDVIKMFLILEYLSKS